jgi:hypothetical protein
MIRRDKERKTTNNKQQAQKDDEITPIYVSSHDRFHKEWLPREEKTQLPGTAWSACWKYT